MAQQIVNLGTLADGSDGDTNKVAWGKAKDNFAELYGRMVGKGYISGLQMKWVSGTALTITSGSAYIQGTGTVLFSDSDIAKTGLSLTASTWYHAYVYDNAGTPDFVLSATAPATAYNGAARSMTGDSSKRYVISVKTDASGHVVQFQHDANSNKVTYLGADYAPRNLLAAGVATAATNVSCASIVPVTGVSIDVLLTNADAVATVETSNSLAALPMGGGTGHSYFGYVRPNGGTGITNHPIDGSQQINYLNLSASTSGLYIDLNGYTFER